MSDPILAVAQMRAAEQQLIDDGTDVHELMRRAGQGAAAWVWRMAAGRPVTVLCGPGNNGGDGYVLAKWLRAKGSPVCVIALQPPRTDAARRAAELYGGPVQPSAGDISGDILVECLFGTGQNRPLDVATQALLDHCVARHRRVVAIDLPANVDADSGALLGPVATQAMTLALGAWKPAHWLMPAAMHMGLRQRVEIGLAPITGGLRLALSDPLNAPAPDAHKYTRGMVGVIGGDMPGAALLAAKAAMHGGAGYVKLLPQQTPAVVPDALVVDTKPLPHALDDPRFAALLVGPGLGRGDAALERLAKVLAAARPTVIDADALHLLEPGMVKGRSDLVVTPHEGELARLCARFGIPAGSKLARVQALSQVSGLTVLAKGPDTVLAAADGYCAILPPATPWLSTAGTGDVLAGLLASRLATGAAPVRAAAQASRIHAQAARASGAAWNADGLVKALPAAYAALL
ncbi:NAD(P)H-hydrate dehydratase [Croceibacterium xixiisoli]|nr:NAD(P)H-hydrate dehydratase [Croceibacterium xixiisoli]